MGTHMHGSELTEARDVLHWTKLALSKELGVSEITVRRWEDDRAPIPERVAEWVRARVAAHREMPAPKAPERPGKGGRPPGGSLYALRPKDA